MTSRSSQASLQPPERSFASYPSVNSILNQSPTRDVLPQPQTPGSANSGRRKKGIWKGEVKSCTVIAGELRGQLSEEREEEVEESISPTRPPARVQPEEKKDEQQQQQMNWREELDRFRVP